MLYIQTEPLDISMISKIIVKHNARATVTNNEITLYGNISEELLNDLFEIIKINTLQIFREEAKENPSLLYPVVKRGEVYLCDFGDAFGSEQGFVRYAVIVQNDIGNLHSPTTIVLPCTTKTKKKLPVHYSLVFSKENMLDYDPQVISYEKNVILAEQIRCIDKKRLQKYLGTLTPESMNKLQDVIDISLGLTR